MQEFKLSNVNVNVNNITLITRTEEEKTAYQKALGRFEKEMRIVRADAVHKAAQSQLSALKRILNS